MSKVNDREALNQAIQELNDFEGRINLLASDTFKLVRVALKRQSDLKQVLKQILELVNLSTESIDKIKVTSKHNVKYTQDYDVYSQADGTINKEYEIYMDNLNRARIAKTLK